MESCFMYRILLVSLLLAMAVGCGGKQPAPTPTADPDFPGAVETIPRFRPSRLTYRIDYPPDAPTGYRWTLETESPFEETTEFYDRSLPERREKAPLTTKVKKDVMGMRYTYQSGRSDVEIYIDRANHKFTVTETRPDEPTPSESETP